MIPLKIHIDELKTKINIIKIGGDIFGHSRFTDLMLAAWCLTVYYLLARILAGVALN